MLHPSFKYAPGLSGPFQRLLGLQLPLDVHTESKQYAVIICEQFRRTYSVDSIVVLFRRIADQVTAVASIWEVQSSCLSMS